MGSWGPQRIWASQTQQVSTQGLFASSFLHLVKNFKTLQRRLCKLNNVFVLKTQKQVTVFFYLFCEVSVITSIILINSKRRSTKIDFQASHKSQLLENKSQTNDLWKVLKAHCFKNFLDFFEYFPYFLRDKYNLCKLPEIFSQAINVLF